ISDSTFKGNTAGEYGGGLALYSGNLFASSNNTFTDNQGNNGGAISVVEIKEVEVKGSLFCHNTASANGGGARVSDSGSTSNYWRNNIFAENAATNDGGAIAHQQSTNFMVYNNHFIGNSSATGGGIRVVDSTVDFVNNIVAFTTSGDGLSSNTTTGNTIDYNDFYNNITADLGGGLTSGHLGTGNITDDPLLTTYSANGDCSDDLFWPDDTSTTIDAGDPTINDTDGTRSDIGSYGGPDANVIPAVDLDGDGYTTVDDCDDTDANVNPAADEKCDTVDNNCDGKIDDSTSIDADSWYLDDDGDGYGDKLGVAVTACTEPTGYVLDNTDCDDADADIYPGATEICDGLDNDCDTEIDEGLQSQTKDWYLDADGDGYGDPNELVQQCSPPPGYVDNFADCDDSDDSINPDAEETCDGVDEDCDGTIDNDATDAETWYEDADADGYGNIMSTTDDCNQPKGYVEDDTDCDDTDANYHPNAPEDCHDTEDYNCDGVIGDDDADGDGFMACDDCDDTNAAIHPDATEVWYDGIDQNCDGNDGDQDGDGYNAEQVNGSDCDDLAADVNPGEEDTDEDGIDQDCDGVDGDGSSSSTTPKPFSDEDLRPSGGGCGCNTSAPFGGSLFLLGLAIVAIRRSRNS
ncbi:MAG: hypothetical protein HN348_17810, partial [Proteobacteria bacterium]|nr:hypothetical protein [Pseudomonadota bacterium]